MGCKAQSNSRRWLLRAFATPQTAQSRDARHAQTRAALPYTARMLWVKAFHIVFVASWFAGLFYLPRIFVNLAMVAPGSAAERDRLLLMARKLLRFTTMLAVPALVL